MAEAPEQLGQSIEDYLKAIFTLGEPGQAVSTNAIAQMLKVSPAAVTKALQLLSKRGLVKYERYRGVALRPKGRKAALETIRHHRLLESFLHDILGYTWDEVDEEAERLEHHVSRKFIAAIDKLLNYPSFDPHGAPIPSQDGEVDHQEGFWLSECEPGDKVFVVLVSDVSPEMLRYLDGVGMHPCTEMEVLSKQPLDGPLTVRVDHTQHVVGHEMARHVLVKKTEDALSASH